MTSGERVSPDEMRWICRSGILGEGWAKTFQERPVILTVDKMRQEHFSSRAGESFERLGSLPRKLEKNRGLGEFHLGLAPIFFQSRKAN